MYVRRYNDRLDISINTKRSLHFRTDWYEQAAVSHVLVRTYPQQFATTAAACNTPAAVSAYKLVEDLAVHTRHVLVS